MSLTNKDKFADAAQEIALGRFISSIEAPGISVSRFEKGLTIQRGDETIKIDTTAGIVGAGDETFPLRSTSEDKDMKVFKAQSNGAYSFGKTYSNDREFVLYAAPYKSFIRIDDANGVLVIDLNKETRGVAVFNNDILRTGVIQMPETGLKATPSLDRDLSPLTPAMI
ncbi:MAG: hypothetical protein DYH13_06095 [Alphaproteobacteria bacterium PRO2]|nr:hypothetical protein [Alphaproteobacteria bacterium PRO2]